MVHIVAGTDRVKEASSTTGTGSLTLTGAVAGFQSMASKLTANGDTGWFCAVNGAEWELFLGTRTSSTVLARTTVLASSNSGAAVSFTAPPVAFMTLPSSALVAAAAPAFRAYLSADQSGVPNATFTKINFNTKEFDTNGCFDNATNYRFTPNVPGYYLFNWLVLGSGASLTGLSATLRKNGTVAGDSTYYPISTGAQRLVGSRLIYMNGTTDYVELFGYLVGSTLKFGSGVSDTSLSGHFVRPG